MAFRLFAPKRPMIPRNLSALNYGQKQRLAKVCLMDVHSPNGMFSNRESYADL